MSLWSETEISRPDDSRGDSASRDESDDDSPNLPFELSLVGDSEESGTDWEDETILSLSLPFFFSPQSPSQQSSVDGHHDSGSLFSSDESFIRSLQPRPPSSHPSEECEGSLSSGLRINDSSEGNRDQVGPEIPRVKRINKKKSLKSGAYKALKEACAKDLRNGMDLTDAKRKYLVLGVNEKAVKRIAESGSAERKKGSGRKVACPVVEAMAVTLACGFIYGKGRLPEKGEMAELFEEFIERVEGKEKRGWADKFLKRNDLALENHLDQSLRRYGVAG